ncbi:hypothetical protein [Burkholderia vietnamiensis]|uniref:hypothetical protein n=1 Tax=Burkholderia vietnamiensis TaxID=60552 RepID=UPI001CB5A8EB|nr:hypothetical protein [Burkholderia vietnamiensis]CAG9229330.1 hypothetical protein BVI1335_70192 [Burkholderia vietnamiensis]HDR9086284.1 hypothetical protein [Burkholderia vietnamiensis]
MDRALAEAAGYTVDTTVYPWLAYKGPRFAPVDARRIDTPEWQPAKTGSSIDRQTPGELRAAATEEAQCS